MSDQTTPTTPAPDLRAIAFDLAAQGFKVFPLQPNSKLPVPGISWKGLVCQTEMDAWDLWTQPRYRACNVGIHCEGLIVVDVDLYKDTASEAEAWLEALGLPQTFTVQTPRGGRHLYFKGPDVANSASKIAPGIDVRGIGGYVLGPGSVTPDGTYRVIDARPLADAPQALVGRCKAAKESQNRDSVDWGAETSAARLQDGRAYLATAPVSVEGSGGNDTAFRVISDLWDRGVSASGALDLLLEDWNGRCLPPWSIDELRGLINNAHTYATNNFATRAADQVFGEVIIPEQPEQPARSNAILGNLFSFADFAGKKAPAFRWLVPGLIPADNVTLLYGDGGTGKSLLAMQLAVATASGRDWVGHAIARKGPVLFYSAEESPDEMHGRAEKVCAAMGAQLADLDGVKAVSMVGAPEAAFATFDRNDVLQETDIWRDLVAAVQAVKPVLLVVDTLADVFAGDEIKRVQARAFVAMLRRLATAQDLAVLVLAHPSQSGIQTGSGSSGSTAWSNSVRSRLYFQRDKATGKKDADLRVLSVEKANYGAIGASTAVRWVDGCFLPLAQADIATHAANSEAAFLDCLRDTSSRGLFFTKTTGTNFAPAAFKDMPQAHGFSRDDLRAAMERLEARGAIRVETYRKDSKDRSRIAEVLAEDQTAVPASLFGEGDEPTAEHLAALCEKALVEQHIASDSASNIAKEIQRLDPALLGRKPSDIKAMLKRKLPGRSAPGEAVVRYLLETAGNKAGAPKHLISRA